MRRASMYWKDAVCSEHDVYKIVTTDPRHGVVAFWFECNDCVLILEDDHRARHEAIVELEKIKKGSVKK